MPHTGWHVLTGKLYVEASVSLFPTGFVAALGAFPLAATSGPSRGRVVITESQFYGAYRRKRTKQERLSHAKLLYVAADNLEILAVPGGRKVGQGGDGDDALLPAAEVYRTERELFALDKSVSHLDRYRRDNLQVKDEFKVTRRDRILREQVAAAQREEAAAEEARERRAAREARLAERYGKGKGGRYGKVGAKARGPEGKGAGKHGGSAYSSSPTSSKAAAVAASGFFADAGSSGRSRGVSVLVRGVVARQVLRGSTAPLRRGRAGRSFCSRWRVRARAKARA